MKFAIRGYIEEEKWNAMSKGEQEAMMEECLAYDDELLKRGHWVDGGQSLQSVRTAKTLRRRGSKVLITDGPYAETKEQLGGVVTFRFRDMDHAIDSWSNHRCLRIGDSLEIRPADEEFNARWEARQERIESQSHRYQTI